MRTHLCLERSHVCWSKRASHGNAADSTANSSKVKKNWRLHVQGIQTRTRQRKEKVETFIDTSTMHIKNKPQHESFAVAVLTS